MTLSASQPLELDPRNDHEPWYILGRLENVLQTSGVITVDDWNRAVERARARQAEDSARP